jgi:platelet-activating factor acetylhydrolase IB subunit alpha
MPLTERQREELELSLLDFLRSSGYQKAAEAFAADTGRDASDPVEGKYQGLLEKKWTSVVRLQKKVMDLEAKLGDAKLVIAAPKLGGKRDAKTWLPRRPETYVV